MLALAKEKNAAPNIVYQCMAMEDLQLPAASFDVVFSSLAFHYVADFPAMIKKIQRWLKEDGQLIFSVEHPVFTSYGSQDWYYDEKGQILHFPVDHYYEEGARKAHFLGETVCKYHRTLTTYFDTLLQQGFCLQHIVEPKPPAAMLDLPGMRDELLGPIMLLISAKKISNPLPPMRG